MPGMYMPEGGQTPKMLMEYAPPGVQPELPPPAPTAPPQPTQDTSYSTGGGDFGPAEQAPEQAPMPREAITQNPGSISGVPGAEQAPMPQQSPMPQPPQTIQPQAPMPEQAPMPQQAPQPQATTSAPQPQAPVVAPGQPAAQQAPGMAPPVSAPGQPAAQQAPGMAKPMGKIGMAPHIAGIAPEAASFNEGVKADALRRILGIGGAGLVGGAGIAGLMQLFKHITKPKMPSYEVPEDVEMPYPQIAEKRSFSPADLQHVGQAIGGVGLKGALMHGDNGIGDMAVGAARELPNAPLTAIGSLVGKHQMHRLAEHMAPKQKLLQGLAGIMGMIGGGGMGYAASKPTIGALTKESDWADSVVHNVIPTPAGVPAPSVGTPRWLRGDTQDNIVSLPWGIPLAMGAAAGGLTGGSALVNWLMKKHRKSKLKGEVEKATKDYESAMLAQYDPKKIHKIGSEVATLDKLGDQAEKQGFNFNSMLGAGAGSYGALAALLAGAAGYGTYKWEKGRSKDKLLENALRQRAMMRSLEHPPDIYINPVGMPLKHNAGTADELDTEASRPAL